MDVWLIGIEQVFQWYNLLLIFLGVFIGLSFASLPGLNNVTALVLMLPFVYDMSPVSATIFMCSIYGGGLSGGCILAILFGIPGEPQAVCTTFDGGPMAKQGRAAEALGIAFTYATLGGLFGVIVCIIFAPLLSNFALAFGPAEYFAFVFFGLVVASSVGADSVLKGLIAACAGLLLATVGVSPGSGVMRYTGDINILQMGIEYVPIIMGVFAISELIRMVIEGNLNTPETQKAPSWMVKLPGLKFMRKTWATFLRSASVGTLIGFLPGAGATAATFVSYGLTVKNSKTPEKFGKGEPEGIIASETANNSSYGGAMIPMLTMGIPGSSSTAVMLGVLMLKGIQPSPEVFNGMPELVYAVFVCMLIVDFIMFMESILFGRIYLNLLKLPPAVICFIIAAFCIVGTFSIRSSIEDVWIMGIFGVLGFFMHRYGFPVASLVLGVILGELAETTFIQTVDMANSPNPLVFFEKPISASLMVIGLALLIYPLIKSMIHIGKTSAKKA